MYKIFCPFLGFDKWKSDTSLNKTVTSWCAIFRAYITQKYYIIIQKMRSIFPFLGTSREFPLISPQNGHPSCPLGFDSSDVEAWRGSISSSRD
jgi:hypothetical protein